MANAALPQPPNGPQPPRPVSYACRMHHHLGMEVLLARLDESGRRTPACEQPRADFRGLFWAMPWALPGSAQGCPLGDTKGSCTGSSAIACRCWLLGALRTGMRCWGSWCARLMRCCQRLYSSSKRIISIGSSIGTCRAHQPSYPGVYAWGSQSKRSSSWLLWLSVVWFGKAHGSICTHHAIDAASCHCTLRERRWCSRSARNCSGHALGSGLVKMLALYALCGPQHGAVHTAPCPAIPHTAL